jgi:hypothetical protein
MRNEKSGIIFRQSSADFPMMVTLGDKTPLFGLHRFNKPLNFIPPDDEDFTLRGDKRRLLYKGRRHSHRFTILSDTSFEYDCILNKPPDTNVISLLIEGAEHYDFFRQPDFVKDPFLKGSYAVYKKETLIGEGTGKLCHIHRPEIIDARGRRCWGDLAVVGNQLRITIPEQWLGEASYPVIVDPIIGTTTVGKQQLLPNITYEEFVEFYLTIAVNRFLVPETLNGLCTAYAYAYISDRNEGGYGVIYSDNENKPVNKKSRDEEYIDLSIFGYNEGWGKAPFDLNEVIQSGTYIWFGINANERWNPLYDYGSRCYITQNKYFWEPPPTFPTSHYYLDMKLSMYFSYTKNNKFVRTIYQDIKLTDTRKLKVDYKKILKQTVKVNSTMKKIGNYIRKSIQTAINTMKINRKHSAIRFITEKLKTTTANKKIQSFMRKLTQNIKPFDSRKSVATYNRSISQTVKANTVLQRFEAFIRTCRVTASTNTSINRFPAFMRTITDYIKTTTVNFENRSLSRKCTDNVKPQSAQQRIHNAFRKFQSGFTATDRQSFSVLFIRSLPDTATPSDKSRHIGTFIRSLLLNADTLAKTSHTAEYHRFQKDNVQAKGPVFRGLLLFVHIVTKVFIRDYLLGRFLKAREDLQLKSVICRELTLESKVN